MKQLALEYGCQEQTPLQRLQALVLLSYLL
jgi:hypothetical protein